MTHRTVALSLLLTLPLAGCSTETAPPPQTAAAQDGAAARGAAPAEGASESLAPDAQPATAPAAEPERPFDELSTPEKAEVMVSTVETLGALHEKNAADCPALARAIETFHGEKGDTLANSPPEVNAYIDGDDALHTRVRAAMKKVMEASMGCAKDPEFMALQERLFPSDSRAKPAPAPAPEGAG